MKLAKGLVSAALVVSLTPLAGCRYSDVLTLLVEDQETGEVDYTLEPIYEEVPGAPEDPTRVSTLESVSDNQAEQENTLPDYADQPNDTQEADNRVTSPDSPNRQQATEGDEPDSAQEGTTRSGTDDGQGESTQPPDDASTEDQSTGTGEGDSPETTDNGAQGQSPSSGQGTGGSAQIYDDGTYEQLPEEVSAIAATGEYALIVQMLAGQGGLAAVEEGWSEAMSAIGAFPDEGIADLPTAWSATANTIDLNAVIESGADVVLTDGVAVTLTEEQSAELTALGINVVVMPRLGDPDTPDENITTAVKVIGELLKNADTQYDAGAMAALYVDQHDAALNDCKAANGGYSYKMVGGMAKTGIYQGTDTQGRPTAEVSENRVTTAFIDGWVGARTNSIVAERSFGFNKLYLDGQDVDASDGAGLSVKATSANFALLDYYLQVSGVVNNAYDTAKPSSVTSSASQSYPVVAGGTQGIFADTVQTCARNAPSALWYSQNGYTLGDHWTLVGDDDFPGVIVRDQAIGDPLVASAAKVNGLYNVGQPYEVYVMPSGVAGNWADGTVESFLAAPWAYGVFRQAGDLTQASTYVNAFYETFYRVPNAADEGKVNAYGTARTALCPTT